MKNNIFKKTEKVLYDYKNLDIKIQNIDLHINTLENDISVSGVSYEERSSPTNAFSSVVENNVIKREEFTFEQINKLEILKNKTINLKKSIDNALNTLNHEERELVELRYFSKNKKTWVEIGMLLSIDKDYCSKLKNRIINQLSNYLYFT
ncbi:xanthine dehydrogenase [Clostridium botulinum]|uniref:xanthine dehydrogenase n=1 Tax=Clostridium botulinum TaxID=1491 RepID=UPI0013F99C7B|nr:xanthine dehydrogenase [Clostridium botulinum]MBY6860759.1 DUF722 domain-containing protein [Clostridium botulinum]MBY7043797.1 DUF722 domain-containing protein [Clostridium botulinum]NFO58640.1 DUF722 domain-containing protein [Clostridium botulinum]